jgi:hypothetical protein
VEDYKTIVTQLSHGMPSEALRISFPGLLEFLDVRLGHQLYLALDPLEHIPGPLKGNTNCHWMRTANTVGVNVRTIGDFFKLIPYALTLPSLQDTIHLLPVWEPGVVASLYGPASWNINPEFFNAEVAQAIPTLDTVEKQLKVVINILHALGFKVGLDVVPHTDRYSEMVIANPHLFEWLQRDGLHIVRHDDKLVEFVCAKIHDFHLQQKASVGETPKSVCQKAFFQDLPESERLQLLFGAPHDYKGRLERRKDFVQMLFEAGLETVPATMGPPYRGIEVDPDPQARVIDEEGREWRDYRIVHPQKFSRVFGPLARYKLYESRDDNRNWELDFSKPNQPAWDYVCSHYRDIQAHYGFDFMRGDMSHVQMRPSGVPPERDRFYDLLGAVKQAVLPEKPWFGYFAESFLAPPDEMAYGDECDHLEASFADSTLGDLQSEPVGTERFVRMFAQYDFWLKTRSFSPNFTIMTADKDDPRFDSFYLAGNEIRYFIALFLTDMPSYMGLGFECRDPHPEPASNEHYTKLYVFKMHDGPKGTKGPYQWGANTALHERLVRLKERANEWAATLANTPTRWLIPPDPEGKQKVIAWTQAASPAFVFMANLDTVKEAKLKLHLPEGEWRCVFSTHQPDLKGETSFGQMLEGVKIGPGEGLVWKK